MTEKIIHDHHRDGIDRRGFLKCMAWVGNGVLYTVSGGILRSDIVNRPGARPSGKDSFRFAQISDSHIGFKHKPNQDVTATLQEAVDRLNALPEPPDFIIHTGDLTHLSKPSQPGTAPSPGPIKDVPSEKLRSLLGLTSVNYVQGGKALAVIDSTLADP